MYCNAHQVNNCPCKFYEAQTKAIVDNQNVNTKKIVDAIKFVEKRDAKNVTGSTRRRADWPLIVSQIISVVVLVAAVVISLP